MAEKLIKQIESPMTPDDRGFVCFPLDEEVLARGEYYNVHIPSMKPGVVRGNHRHPAKEEYVFIMGERCRVVAEDQETRAREELYFEQQPDKVLVFPANVAHAIKNEGTEVVYLFCYNKREEGDRQRPETKRAEILK
jgi:dTDP-4-dehydrorhamnose 3,5-epimerase-like enzyme